MAVGAWPEGTRKTLVTVRDFFDRYNQGPHHMLLVIGSHAANIA